MANLLNNPRCVTLGGSSGVPNCPIDPKIIVGAILMDPSKTYGTADLTDFITTLQGDTVGVGKERIHPIFRFVEMTDSSEDVTIQTLGYGNKLPIKDGKFDWMFRFMKGGLCLNANLREFNYLEKKVLFVTEDNTIIGTLNSDGDMTGFSLDFVYTYPFKPADGSKTTEYKVRFAQSKPSEWDNYAVWYAGTAVDIEEEVKGLIDVELAWIASESGMSTIKVQTKCDKVNLYDDYSVLLADTDLWIVTNSSGADVSVTGVVADAIDEAFEVSFTGTGTYTISLESPKNLSTAGVGGAPGNGYESGTVDVTVPTS